MNKYLIILITSLLLVSCGRKKRGDYEQIFNTMTDDSTKQYGYNRDFLARHVELIELKSGKSAIIIIPDWQGRVMSSTSEGDKGYSFGWINHELIETGEIQPHINPFGGEERLWIGPEGGQFSIFFKKGSSFVYDEWQTPAFIDTEPYDVINRNDSSVLLSFDVETKNYSATLFNFRLERNVVLLDADEVKRQAGIDVTGTNYVAYRSDNKIINTGEKSWKKETGLLSIWMLGMFNPSPAVIVVIPYKQGDEQYMGPPVNDNYFGKIPDERLKVTGNHIFFRADGQSRGKIGLPPLRTTGTLGSYDSENNILTLLICSIPEGITDYVNSSWEIQEDPFSGDAVNSYNDGPLDDGSQMGPFYELETSSPGAALAPGERLTHTQFTIHLTGKRENLNVIANDVLGVSLDEIENAFK